MRRLARRDARLLGPRPTTAEWHLHTSKRSQQSEGSLIILYLEKVPRYISTRAVALAASSPLWFLFLFPPPSDEPNVITEKPSP